MLLAAVTRYVCFALKALKLPVFSFELTLLTFSVSYLWIISYIFQEYEEPVYSYSTYPVRRSPRDIHNILKMSPPFASSEGVSVSGDRYQSDDACRTQPQSSLLFISLPRENVLLDCSHFLILLLLIFALSFTFLLLFSPQK